MSPATFDLFNSIDFRAGLLVGIVGLAIAIGVVLAQRASMALPLGGVLIAVAAAVALRVPLSVALGAAALAAGGFAYPWTRKLPMLPAVAAVPGALIIALSFEDPQQLWLPAFVIVAIAAAAPLVSSFTTRYAQQAWGPALFALSALGVLFAVPDTEEALVLFAVTLPLAFLSWPSPLASLAPVGAYPLVGILVWVIVTDGATRPSAMVGTMAVLGVLVAEPIVAWVSHGLPLGGVVAGWRALVMVGGFHAVIVVGAARVAAQRPDMISAGIVGAVLLVLLAGVLYASQPKSRSRSA